MEQVTFYLGIISTVFSIIGIPSVIGMAGWCIKHCIKITKQIIILQKAQKAQMRAQLLKDYEFYHERGYVLPAELKEWMNEYKAYHELVGENEVLDERKKVLNKLPNKKGGKPNE